MSSRYLIALYAITLGAIREITIFATMTSRFSAATKLKLK